MKRNVLNALVRYSQELNTYNGDIMDRKTLSVPEAGTALGIGRSAAYEAARTGQLPTIRIGKRLLVPMAALERFLERVQGPNEPEALVGHLETRSNRAR